MWERQSTQSCWAHPKATESFVNGFLADTGIDVDFEFQQFVWLEAGRRFARYARRRGRTAHHGPKRLLADFIIGSHARKQADRLMTLDPKRYKQDFPEADHLEDGSTSLHYVSRSVETVKRA